MTVDELVAWIKNAKAIAKNSGQSIGAYEVEVQRTDGVDYGSAHPRIDHGRNAMVIFTS